MNQNKKIQSHGFTLFELLVVISIIGVITALAVVSYSQAQIRARDSRRQQDLKSWQKALEQYYAQYGTYLLAGCDPGDTYLVGDAPLDPKTGASYEGTDSCTATGYCLCGELDVAGSGNSSDNACSYGAGDFFCVSSLQ